MIDATTSAPHQVHTLPLWAWTLIGHLALGLRLICFHRHLHPVQSDPPGYLQTLNYNYK